MPRGRRKPAPSGRCGLKTNAGGISVFPMLARLRSRESGALASCSGPPLEALGVRLAAGKLAACAPPLRHAAGERLGDVADVALLAGSGAGLAMAACGAVLALWGVSGAAPSSCGGVTSGEWDLRRVRLCGGKLAVADAGAGAVLTWDAERLLSAAAGGCSAAGGGTLTAAPQVAARHRSGCDARKVIDCCLCEDRPLVAAAGVDCALLFDERCGGDGATAVLGDTASCVEFSPAFGGGGGGAQLIATGGHGGAALWDVRASGHGPVAACTPHCTPKRTPKRTPQPPWEPLSPVMQAESPVGWLSGGWGASPSPVSRLASGVVDGLGDAWAASPARERSSPWRTDAALRLRVLGSPDGPRRGASRNPAVWNRDLRRYVAPFVGHADEEVTGIAFVSGGTRLMTTAADGVHCVWDATDGRGLRTLCPESAASSNEGDDTATTLRPALASDESLVCTGNMDGSIRAYGLSATHDSESPEGVEWPVAMWRCQGYLSSVTALAVGDSCAVAGHRSGELSLLVPCAAGDGPPSEEAA